MSGNKAVSGKDLSVFSVEVVVTLFFSVLAIDLMDYSTFFFLCAIAFLLSFVTLWAVWQSDKNAKDEHYKLIQELAEEFKEVHTTYICKDLLQVAGKQSPVSEERTPEYYKTRPCVRFVITACEILDKHFFS